VKPAEIPQELLDILDRAAGRDHARTGSVVATLAAILGRYSELKAAQWHDTALDASVDGDHDDSSCWCCCRTCEDFNPYFDDGRNSIRNTTASTQNLP
jgi:hypothetical protein